MFHSHPSWSIAVCSLDAEGSAALFLICLQILGEIMKEDCKGAEKWQSYRKWKCIAKFNFIDYIKTFTYLSGWILFMHAWTHQKNTHTHPESSARATGLVNKCHLQRKKIPACLRRDLNSELSIVTVLVTSAWKGRWRQGMVSTQTLRFPSPHVCVSRSEPAVSLRSQRKDLLDS